MLFDSLIDDIRYQVQYGGMLVRLIVVNSIVYVLMGLIGVITYLAQASGVWLWADAMLQLPASLPMFLHQPWSLITYMFYHYGLGHFFFNMLTLYWFGRVFTTYMNERKILPVYLIGGIAGGLLYMLCYNMLPVFQPVLLSSRLAGASAGILAVMCAAATFNPDHDLQLLLIGRVAIKYVVVGMLLIDIIAIPTANAGGYIAHIGGAIMGYLYVVLLRRGTDITGVWDSLQNLFTRRSKLKATHGETRQSKSQQATPTDADQQRLDSILDKIGQSGYNSLTEEEKAFLFRYSNQ